MTNLGWERPDTTQASPIWGLPPSSATKWTKFCQQSGQDFGQKVDKILDTKWTRFWSQSGLDFGLVEHSRFAISCVGSTFMMIFKIVTILENPISWSATIIGHKVDLEMALSDFGSLMTFKICNSYNGHFKYILMYCSAKQNLCITQRSLKVHRNWTGDSIDSRNADIIEQKKLNLTQQGTYMFYEFKRNNMTIHPAHIDVICQSVYKVIMDVYILWKADRDVSDSFTVPRDHVIRRYSKYTCLHR